MYSEVLVVMTDLTVLSLSMLPKSPTAVITAPNGRQFMSLDKYSLLESGYLLHLSTKPRSLFLEATTLAIKEMATNSMLRANL